MSKGGTFRKIIAFLTLLALVYLALGLGFHLGWKQAQELCRAEQIARGEFVEPEMFPLLGVFFDLTWWPVYAAANLYHDGTPFATPCTH